MSKAQRVLAANDVSAEILVANNGGSDGSQEITRLRDLRFLLRSYMKPVAKRGGDSNKRRRLAFGYWASLISVLTALAGQAAVSAVTPPARFTHFRDYAGVISPDVAMNLNEVLAQFDRATSDRLAIVVYPRVPEEVYVGDYARRISEAWNLSQHSATLFVFVEDRKTFIIASPGLQHAFPDDTSFDIASRVMAPKLHTKKYDKAFSLGAEAMIKAATDSKRRPWQPIPLVLGLALGALALWRFKKIGTP